MTFETGRALQLAQPDRGALSPPGARPTPGRRRRSPPTARGANTFALLDVANRYVLNGAAFTPGALAGLTQDQIAGYLTTPASPMTQAVVAAANEISAAICAVDGDKPGAVCHSHGVLAADAALGITPPADADRAGGAGGAPRGSAGASVEHQLALDLVEATPDPVRLTDPDGVVEAVPTDVALPADGLGPELARGLLLLALGMGRREEHRCLRSPARCLQLPRLLYPGASNPPIARHRSPDSVKLPPGSARHSRGLTRDL